DDGAIHELFDRRVFLAVVGYDLCRLATRDAESLAEAEGGAAVDEAEVHHLRAAALLAGDCAFGNAPHLGGSGGVNVAVFAEGLDHRDVIRQRGHDAELDLRVVAGKQCESFAWDERLADLAAERGTDRDVLEVRVGGRESTG